MNLRVRRVTSAMLKDLTSRPRTSGWLESQCAHTGRWTGGFGVLNNCLRGSVLALVVDRSSRISQKSKCVSAFRPWLSLNFCGARLVSRCLSIIATFFTHSSRPSTDRTTE